MTKTNERKSEASQREINGKIITLFLLIFSFSGNFSETAVAHENYVSYNKNIYSIDNKSYILNINKINFDKLKEKPKALVKRTVIQKWSRGRKMSKAFELNALKIMNAVKYHESRGNYKSSSRFSSACGAYQYIDSTWNNFHGYKTACDAPKDVQDQRMFNEIYQRYIDKNGDWEKVIAAHFVPAWSDNKALWNRRPGGKYNPTVWEYVNKVMRTAGMK